MRQSAREPEHAAAPPSRLSELLDCERELAELLEEAREEARRVVERAREEAAHAEAELEASLEAESERVRQEIGEASQTRIHEVLGRARDRAARFERRSDEDVDRLAESALRRLVTREDRR